MTWKAKEILDTSDAEWDRIAPLGGPSIRQRLRAYRKHYHEGIRAASIDDEEDDVRTLYGVLATLGGEQLVGCE